MLIESKRNQPILEIDHESWEHHEYSTAISLLPQWSGVGT